MTNLKDIRKRIIAIKNTQKITRVMAMISAAKLYKAKRSISKSKPYHLELKNIFLALCKTDTGLLKSFFREPAEPKVKTAVLLLSSDKGLCGAFNSALCKKLSAFLDKNQNTDLFVVGKKGKEFFKYHNNLVIVEGYYQEKEIELKNIVPKIARTLMQSFLQKKYDEIYLAFNCFVSSIYQEPQIQKFLPLLLDREIIGDKSQAAQMQQAIFEPSLKAISNELLPVYLENLCYTCLLDSFAGEHASRMRIMDAATNNARDLITKLQMQYNRARQASITTELTEIISGAESVS